MATSKMTQIIFGGLPEQFSAQFDAATSKENVDEIVEQVS